MQTIALAVVSSDLVPVLRERLSIEVFGTSGDAHVDPEVVATAIGDGQFDALLYAESVTPTLSTDVATLREASPDLPILVLLNDGAVSSAAVVDAGASDVVDIEGDSAEWLSLLDHRLRTVLGRPDGDSHSSDGDATEVLEQLYAAASAVADREQESEIYRTAIEGANEAFEFDACTIAELDSGEFVPRAATESDPHPGRRRLGADEGTAGQTYRTGETVLMGDRRTESEMDSPYRSVISVPMDEFGVFQLASTAADAYDEADRDRAELLATQVENAIERARFERALTRERDRFVALFQNIPDAAIEYTFDDGVPRIEAVNSAFVSYFGYEPEQAVGKTTLELLVPDDAKDDAYEMYDGIREGQRLDRSVERLTVDGPAHVLLRSVPLSTEDGVQRGYVIYTDIEALVQRERELERQNERLDAFASMVSHDLRNPINVARGYLDLARQREDDQHFEKIEDSLGRMETIIEDMLTLARQGEDIGEVRTVDVEDVVREAWTTVETGAATVSVGAVPAVEGDPTRIQQLFENLFRNAVEHGGDEVTITVDGFDGGFFIADDGAGIPDNMKDDILDMGVSTAKGEGGTGIGLAIVTEIAAAHGWSVAVTDSETGGARFDIHIEQADLLE
jgi:PAS domain S-box-containing protein